MSMIRRVAIALAFVGPFAKVLADTLPSSYPHVYSNEPSTDLGPDWQKCDDFAFLFLRTSHYFFVRL